MFVAQQSSGAQRRAHHTVVVLELFTGVAAFVSGILLAVDPHGRLLNADESSLQGSPFENWRVPGFLLATLVGVGLSLAGAWSLAGWRHARALSIVAGSGLVVFELAEMVWLGLQPLEFVFCGVGAAIAVLSWRT